MYFIVLEKRAKMACAQLFKKIGQPWASRLDGV